MNDAQTTDSPHPLEGDTLLTAREVAQLLRVSRTYVAQETRAGRLPVIRLGRSIRYRHSAVEHYLTRATDQGGHA